MVLLPSFLPPSPAAHLFVRERLIKMSSAAQPTDAGSPPGRYGGARISPAGAAYRTREHRLTEGTGAASPESSSGGHTGAGEKTLLLPCNTAAETPLQPQIWCFQSGNSNQSSYPEELFLQTPVDLLRLSPPWEAFASRLLGRWGVQARSDQRLSGVGDARTRQESRTSGVRPKQALTSGEFRPDRGGMSHNFLTWDFPRAPNTWIGRIVNCLRKGTSAACVPHPQAKLTVSLLTKI